MIGKITLEEHFSVYSIDFLHTIFQYFFERGGAYARGSVPFRFENMWLKAEGFTSLILDWWNNLEFKGSGSYVLMERLKALKVKLKSWNREVFGRVEEIKKSSLEKASLLGRG